jgi:hypothetical protein
MVKICSLVIGDDYRKGLSKALDSKRCYAKQNNYTYIEGDEKFWDRERPISWSKILFLKNVLLNAEENELIFWSDADVYMTNMNVRLEDQVFPLLPDTKDLLLSIDACGHINAGNFLMRNTPWARDFLKRVYEQTDVLYHIWWDTAAVIKLLEENTSDLAKTEITNQHKKFNAYIQGLPNEPLWTQGDLLVHFAGIYDVEKMKDYMNQIDQGVTPRKSMF